MALTTPGGISYEWVGPLRKSVTTSGRTISGQAEVSLPNAVAFEKEVLGYSELVGGVLKRYLPLKDPMEEKWPCTDVALAEIIGAPAYTAAPAKPTYGLWEVPAGGGETTLTAAALMRYDLTFSSVLYRLLTDAEITGTVKEWDRFTWCDFSFSSEATQLIGRRFVAKDVADTVADRYHLEAPALHRYGATVRLHWVDLPAVPPNLMTAMNKATSADFTYAPQGLFWPKGQILVGPPELECKVSAAGQRSYDVTLNLLWRPVGWQSAIFPTRSWMAADADKGPGFYPVVTEPLTGTDPVGNKPPYEEYDLANVFSFTVVP